MKKAIIAIFIVAVVSFTIGLYVGDNYGNGRILGPKINPQEKGDYKDTFSDGWEAARQKLISSGALMTMTDNEIKNLSGKIIEIKGNKVVFETELLSPLDPENLKTRTAEITDNTKNIFYRMLTVKEREEKREAGEKNAKELRFKLEAMQQEFRACENKANSAIREDADAIEEEDSECEKIRQEYYNLENEIMEAEMSIYDDYEQVDNAKISDFKENYSITVYAEENIAEKSEFTAIKVEVRERAQIVEMPEEEEV